MNDLLTPVFACFAVIAIAVVIPFLYKLYCRRKVMGFTSGSDGMISLADKTLGELEDGEMLRAMVTDLSQGVKANTKWIRLLLFIRFICSTCMIFIGLNYLAAEYNFPIFGEPISFDFSSVLLSASVYIVFAVLCGYKVKQHASDKAYLNKLSDTFVQNA